MDTSKALASRKTVRRFKSQQITEIELDTILRAGGSAPVGMGEYASLHLTVIQKKDLLERISKSAGSLTGNTEMDMMYGAPTLVIVSAKENRTIPNIQYLNTGCVMENMLLAATDLGIGSAYLVGILTAFGNAELLKELNLPADFHPVSAAAFGYPDEAFREEEMTNKIETDFIR